MALQKIYYLHEIGSKRNQEDYLWPPPGTATLKDNIFIVCDGVGGSENGELASKMIAEFTGAYLSSVPAEKLSRELINELLLKAQEKLTAHARQYALNTDMATTFSLLALSDHYAFVAWCGDTRVYQVRDGVILYKTSDHSLVNTLVKTGTITEEEAANHPQRNIILKAIKADDSPIEADAIVLNDVKDGDFFVLCTDGVIENINDNVLTTLLASVSFSQNGIIDMFQKYCYGKTRDNYSMYLLQTGTTPVTEEKKASKKRNGWLLGFLLIAGLTLSYFQWFHSTVKISVPASPTVISADSIIEQTSTNKEAFDSGEIPEVEIIKIPEKEKQDLAKKTTIVAPLQDSSLKKNLKKAALLKDTLQTPN